VTDAPSRLRLHLAWIWPLLAAPVAFFALLLVSGIIQNVAPAPVRWLSLLPYCLAFAGPVALLVLSARAVGRLFRVLSDADAAHRGLTREEYGVYKGSRGALVKPVNSAGGLLGMSIVLTTLTVVILVLAGIASVQDPGGLTRALEWGKVAVFIFFLFFPAWSWRLYVVERRAQKLRVSRGLPPTLR